MSSRKVELPLSWWDRSSKRRRLAFSLSIIASLMVFGWCSQDDYYKSSIVLQSLNEKIKGCGWFIYWAQVISGNWPGKTDVSLGRYEFSFSVFVAVILNSTTILGILGLLWRTIAIRRRDKVMLLSSSLATRDRLIQNRLETNLKTTLAAAFTSITGVVDYQSTIDEIVESSFKDGNNVWLEEYMPKMIGEKGVVDLRNVMGHDLG